MDCREMETTEIYARLTPIFQDVFNDDALILRPDLTADDVEEWDSLSHIRMVLSVQKAFSVKFSAGEIGKLKNVEGLVDLIRSKSERVA
jgi:acyl carrier protein